MEDITVSELREKLQNGDEFLFIDVREEWEYEEDNLGAKNIPLAQLPHELEELESYKDQEIVMQCRSGARSGNAKKFLETKGFSKVRNLLGGIMAYRSMEEEEG
ncbi:Sulfur carrier protein adenylyltransferase ThiF [Indibacter alkaliphilus LW1]|uniref:Sulfur carrier protein adenylyltransferase ThiF n=1 Tax=Indibacter alkaliphilus (strain CCUG 57479 / KCTC 22604 / LW1) TaxID=1189612 RepID=S2DH46_INDAL|nr:rhodanese-like domain-containing protein [Indibacter alkaliphilus]EOZ98309.1 Sulfur carrier protein adenylyltransferase ThiF [Indibacter alkaliphilus LW1]